VILIVQPDASVSSVVQAIRKARRRIDICVFRLDIDEVERALGAAVQRGVRVRALIAHTNRGGDASLRKLEQRLLADGVTVTRTSDDLLRYHAKYMVADDMLHVFGFNFTKLDILKSRSFGVSTRDRKAVADALKLFEADCTRQPFSATRSNLVVSPETARTELTRFIRGAKRDLAIYDNKLTDPAFLALLRARAKKGVRVRVLGCAKGAPDGVDVRKFKPMRLHVRAIVCDGTRAFVGSQSLRKEELDSRREVGVIVNNPRMARQLLQVFEADWAESAPKGEAADDEATADGEAVVAAAAALVEGEATTAAFLGNVRTLTGALVEDGHEVQLALNGDGTYDQLFADLAAATHRVTLQVYYGNSGRLAGRLRDVLVERARAGVQVLMLYDAFGGAALSPEYLQTLRDAGIRVEPFRPIRLSTLHLIQNRSHVRGIVVDGRVAWTGGFGIDDKWLGDGVTAGAWRETNIRFTGPSVRQMEAAFAIAWAEATGVLLTGERPPPATAAGVRAGLLFTTPSLGSTPAERFLALSIASARRTLYITTAYFAPDAAFVDLLAQAARRGVDVRILTAGPATDMHVVRLAGRSWYATLLEQGVRIYEWQPTVLHSKTFVVDGFWSTVGSMNFDNRSMALNDESTLMVHDAAFGRRMNEVFAADLGHSVEVTREAFAKRSWWQPVLESTAWLFTRLL